jgi:AraC-like DNA-binding protein
MRIIMNVRTMNRVAAPHREKCKPGDASTLVYESPVLRIGRFRCPRGHPMWHHEDCITSGHMVVFPRSWARIVHGPREQVVADPNCVLFHNVGQSIRRVPIDDQGYACEWFAMPASTISSMIADIDPAACSPADDPFSVRWGPSDPAAYIQQRRAFEAASSPEPDSLFIEETFLAALRRVMALSLGAWRGRPRRRSDDTLRAHSDAAEAVKVVLAARFREPLSLSDLAALVHLSEFHLCRVFRAHTGVSIHRYRTMLRLHTALESLRGRNVDLLRLGLSLGFASHAHFTNTFRRAFGMPPSAFRRAQN